MRLHASGRDQQIGRRQRPLATRNHAELRSLDHFSNRRGNIPGKLPANLSQFNAVLQQIATVEPN